MNSIDQLMADIRGEVLLPGNTSYASARRIFNGMIDRRPDVIIQCRGTADIIKSLAYAQDQGGPVAIRGGGHSIAGLSVCDGGVMIDLSKMRSVRVDPQGRRAYVEPGALLGDVDHETQAFGLAVPLGAISHTGVAGLTLGGGVGYLMGKHGFTCDNLLSADVVLADGTLLRASSDRNSDLFWALKGGGGNFGIVSAFEFQLHPVGDVLAGILNLPFDRLRDFLCFIDSFDFPDELGMVVLLTVIDGKAVVQVHLCYAGDLKIGQAIVAEFESFDLIDASTMRILPYVDWQRSRDAYAPPGDRYYIRSFYLDHLDDIFVDQVINVLNTMGSVPSSRTFLELMSIHGACHNVRRSDSAFDSQGYHFYANLVSRWKAREYDQEIVDWMRNAFQGFSQTTSKKVYVNFMDMDGDDQVQNAYRDSTFEKLRRIKARYDPENFFNCNKNIEPWR